MAKHEVSLGATIHTLPPAPRPRHAGQRGSLGALISFSDGGSSRRVLKTRKREAKASLSSRPATDTFCLAYDFPSQDAKVSASRKASKQQLIATTAAVALAAANPAHAGDLFGPEYAGMVGNVVLFIGVGVGAISALFLPIICGTLNPAQIAVNLGLAEGEVSNLRKFKRNGEPMDHGVKFGHKWYNTDAYCNGKKIDFAGTSKTMEAQTK